MIKVYSSTNLFASILIVVKGIQKRIEFKGGTYGGNQQTNSRFRTNDKSVQNAIESHRDFRNNLILIEKEIPEEKDLLTQEIQKQVVAPKAVKLSNTPIDTIETKKVEETKVDTTEPAATDKPEAKTQSEPDEASQKLVDTAVLTHPDVINTQQARKAMKENGITFPVNAKTTDIITEAKKLKYVFPAWEAYNKD